MLKFLFFVFLAFPARAAVVESPDSVVCALPENEELTLPDVMSLALCSNPQTAQAYLSALAAAEDLGTARAAYYPNLDFKASLDETGAKIKPTNEKTDSSTVSANLSLGWLLYDFGARKASVAQAEKALEIALYTQTDALQTLLFDTVRAYFDLFAARAEYENSLATRESAKAALDAAAKRFELGVAAYADKLQAETTFAESELTVAKAFEVERLAHGKLAVLLNENPTAALNLAPPAQTVVLPLPADDFGLLVDTAKKRRADFLAKKTAVEQAQAALDGQKAQNAPSVVLNAGAGAADKFSGDSRRTYRGNVGVSMSVPLFTGFENTHKIKRAKALLKKSRADLLAAENALKTELWTVFQTYRTALKSYEIALTMSASAEQNAAVALGAYKAGRGSILNVLDAQAKLADVRSTKSRSFYAVLTAKAEIVRKTGLVTPFEAEKGF